MRTQAQLEELESDIQTQVARYESAAGCKSSLECTVDFLATLLLYVYTKPHSHIIMFSSAQQTEDCLPPGVQWCAVEWFHFDCPGSSESSQGRHG